jgi:hypothetical protein
MNHFMLALSLLTIASIAHAETECTGARGVLVTLSDDQATVAYTKGSVQKTFAVTSTTSRTGDIDTIYIFAGGNLTLDDQLGASITVQGKKIKLTCDND